MTFKQTLQTIHENDVHQNVVIITKTSKKTTYVPDLRSDITDGRIQRGGTRIRVRIRFSGRPASGSINNNGIS